MKTLIHIHTRIHIHTDVHTLTKWERLFCSVKILTYLYFRRENDGKENKVVIPIRNEILFRHPSMYRLYQKICAISRNVAPERLKTGIKNNRYVNIYWLKQTNVINLRASIRDMINNKVLKSLSQILHGTQKSKKISFALMLCKWKKKLRILSRMLLPDSAFFLGKLTIKIS